MLGRLLFGFAIVGLALAPACSKSQAEMDKACRKGRHLKACEKFGRCTRNDTTMGGTFCHAGSAENCLNSTIACREQGRCGSSGAPEAIDCIVRSDEDCANSIGCKADGFCAKKGKACVATKPEHCLASENCAKKAMCQLGEDSCFVQYMRTGK